MADVTLSPDGKWMWDGTEWIPAPPQDSSQDNQEQTQKNNDMQAEPQPRDAQKITTIDIPQISNRLMQQFPAKTVTPTSQWELAIDSSMFYRYAVRFGISEDGVPFFSRNHTFSLNLRTVRWGAFLFACVLCLTGIGTLIAIPWMIIDWLGTNRNFGNNQLDPYLNQIGYSKLGSWDS